MNTALIALIIATAPAEVPENPQAEAIAQIEESAETGALLFSKGDCLAVRAYTNSPYTHVATIVCSEDGSLVVYDSMNGPGVRKMSLADYLSDQCPDEVQVFKPRRSFNENETSEFQSHLESQLGRPYSVKHHLTGKRCDGLHCAEYVTDALVEIDWLKVKNPPRVSPASLVKGITLHEVYVEGPRIEVPADLEPIPEPEGRCARLWLETKICVNKCGQQFSRWFLCR